MLGITLQASAADSTVLLCLSFETKMKSLQLLPLFIIIFEDKLVPPLTEGITLGYDFSDKVK